MDRQAKKQMWVFLVVILFFGSTIAYTVMQAFGFAPKTQTQNQQNIIPEQRIFDERNTTLENIFIQHGFTVVVFKYNGTSEQNIIQYIQAMGSDADSRIALFKDIQQGTKKSLKATSLLATLTLENDDITTGNIFDMLCNTMMHPPLECGLMLISKENNTNISE